MSKLFGVLVLVAAGVIVGAQWPREAEAQQWPLSLTDHPGRIVNFDSANVVPPTGTVTIPPAGEHEVFQVPGNSWLILRNVEVQPTGANPANTVGLVEGLAGSRRTLRGMHWNDLTSGTDWQWPYVSSTGLCFAPGSRVLLVNEDQADTRGVIYTMTGVLVP